MTDELEPMNAELRDLLRRGAPKLEAPAGAAARVLAGVSAAAAPASVVAAKAATVTLTKATAIAIAAFAAGGAGGVALTSLTTRPPATPPPVERIVYVDRPVPSISSASASAATPSASVVRAADLPDAPQVAPSAGPPAASAAYASALVVERKLLDEARAAFARGDSSEAIRVLERHEKDHPRGQLSEERDALRVRALAELGRAPEARDRAAKFRARYPESLFLPAVEAAVSPK